MAENNTVYAHFVADENGKPESIQLRVVESLSCPNGHPEVENPDEPVDNWRWNIRAYKVHHSGTWWSECRKCKENGEKSWWFNEDGLWG